ncbi:serine/threonine protein kinase [Kitasatospora sp. NPDC096204]|uniref:serine/threonine protein kinase n=1 Tax=Kitasatospora sp. NPDC096204 TaxID=3364094 RepID=UPI003814999D
MRGTVLADRYRLVDWLGGGSMGDVWLAEDEVLGRRVAVKVVKPALLDEPGFAERFHAEARVMAQLRHPGIVGVYDYGHDGGPGEGYSGTAGRRPVGYLVMELIDGQPLSAVLERRGALPAAQALRMALQVLEALEAAHESGVVHRDIKPANLMVRGDRTVIADFGIARPACDARLTVPGMVLGTAAYQAPEQASTGTVTASADLYALGVVLYECLAGRLPYEGETALEVILKHLTEPVPPLPGDVPAPVWALVERAMAKEPGERWPDAATMATAVRRALAAVEGAPPEPAPSPAPGPTRTRTWTRTRPAAVRAPRARRRLRTLAGLTALTLLCVAGAAGATVVRPGRDGAPHSAAAQPPVPEPVALVETARPSAQQTAAPLPPAGEGQSPAPTVGPETPTGSPLAAPPPALPTAPAAAVPDRSPAPPPAAPPAAGQNPAPPAPSPAAPDRPATGEPAPPSASATGTPPPPSVPPTAQPRPQLPAVAQIAGANGALDNYQSADVDGNMVGTYVVNGTSAQLWRLDKVAEGMYYLRNASSNFTKVLDQDRTSRQVQIWSSPPAVWNQVWDIEPVPGGYRIYNVGTRLCLTSEGIGAGTHGADCTGARNQLWTIS